MNTLLKRFACICILVMVPGLTQAATARGWSKYTSEKYQFTMNIPPKWEVIEDVPSSIGNTIIPVTLRSPKEGAKDSFAEEIVLVLEQLPEPETLSLYEPVSAEAYKDASLAVMKKIVPSFRIIRSVPTTFIGLPGYDVSYRIKEPTLNRSLQNKLLLTVNADVNIGASLTLRATPQSYRKYARIFDQVGKSIVSLD